MSIFQSNKDIIKNTGEQNLKFFITRPTYFINKHSEDDTNNSFYAKYIKEIDTKLVSNIEKKINYDTVFQKFNTSTTSNSDPSSKIKLIYNKNLTSYEKI